MAARHPRRLLRPHRDWLVLDFVLAAIGLGLTTFAMVGLGAAIGSTSDLAAISHDCATGRCSHAGTLIARERSHLPGNPGFGGLYTVGPAPDNCILTFSIDEGIERVAITGPLCPALSVPSPITVQIWQGRAVSVSTIAGVVDTYENPSFGVFSGLIKVLALIPAAVCAAMIHFDVVHHRPVYRVHNRLFGWL